MVLVKHTILTLLIIGLCANNFAQAPQFVPFTGRVTDEAGTPLADAQIHLMQRLENFQSHSTAQSDNHGSFTLQLVKGGTGVVFSNGRDAERVVNYALVDSPPQPVELKLPGKGRTLRGTVVDANDNPVPNALVGLAANTREPLGETTPHIRIGMAGAGMMRLQADENGVFETDQAPALPIIVWAAMPDDKKSLHNNFVYSGKPAVLDLKDGDVLDYKATIDPPASMERLTLGGRKIEPGSNRTRTTIKPAE